MWKVRGSDWYKRVKESVVKWRGRMESVCVKGEG